MSSPTGHALQLASVLRAHLLNLVQLTGLLPGIEARALIDIDSLLRPVFGHAKQGASYGHTKLAGKQVLRKGLSPLVTIISTVTGAPVIAGVRLRAGKAGSGKGAASMVRDAIRTARAAGATSCTRLDPHHPRVTPPAEAPDSTVRGEASLVRRLIRVDHRLRDPPPRGDLNALVQGPSAHRGKVDPGTGGPGP